MKVTCGKCLISVLEEDGRRRCAVDGVYVDHEEECSLSIKEKRELWKQVNEMIDEELAFDEEVETEENTDEEV